MAGRIVISIHDGQGRLLAYAGRSLGPGPKYLLPPGFPKSEVLFNLHRASLPQLPWLPLTSENRGLVKSNCGIPKLGWFKWFKESRGTVGWHAPPRSSELDDSYAPTDGPRPPSGAHGGGATKPAELDHLGALDGSVVQAKVEVGEGDTGHRRQLVPVEV